MTPRHFLQLGTRHLMADMCCLLLTTSWDCPVMTDSICCRMSLYYPMATAVWTHLMPTQCSLRIMAVTGQNLTLCYLIWCQRNLFARPHSLEMVDKTLLQTCFGHAACTKAFKSFKITIFQRLCRQLAMSWSLDARDIKFLTYNLLRLYSLVL